MWIFYIFVITCKQSLISQILKAVGPIEKIHIFIPLGIQIEKDFNYMNTRIKLQSSKTSKLHLNDENRIHDQ